MKVLFVSYFGRQFAITVEMAEGTNPLYETHLFNDNGNTERHNIANSLEEAIQNHRYLCEKCGIRVNI